MGKTQELPALCCSDMRAPSYPYCPRSQLLKGSNLCVGLSSLHRRSSYQHWHGPGSLGTARMLCYAPSPSAMCLIQHLKWQCCFLIQERESKQCLCTAHGWCSHMVPLDFHCYFHFLPHTAETANGQPQSQNTVTCLHIIYGTHCLKLIRNPLMLAFFGAGTQNSESGWALLVWQAPVMEKLSRRRINMVKMIFFSLLLCTSFLPTCLPFHCYLPTVAPLRSSNP